MARTWTATIKVGREVIDATPSRSDLLSDQTVSAVREAAMFLDGRTDVRVVLWKTTQAGTREDRSFGVWMDQGKVRYQR